MSSVNEIMTELGDAIRDKSGRSDSLNLSEMVEAVRSIEQGGLDIDLTGVNVTSSDVLKDVVAIDGSGGKIVGNIPTITELEVVDNVVHIDRGYVDNPITAMVPDSTVTDYGDYVVVGKGYVTSDMTFKKCDTAGVKDIDIFDKNFNDDDLLDDSDDVDTDPSLGTIVLHTNGRTAHMSITQLPKYFAGLEDGAKEGDKCSAEHYLTSLTFDRNYQNAGRGLGGITKYYGHITDEEGEVIDNGGEPSELICDLMSELGAEIVECVDGNLQYMSGHPDDPDSYYRPVSSSVVSSATKLLSLDVKEYVNGRQIDAYPHLHRIDGYGLPDKGWVGFKYWNLSGACGRPGPYCKATYEPAYGETFNCNVHQDVRCPCLYDEKPCQGNGLVGNIRIETATFIWRPTTTYAGEKPKKVVIEFPDGSKYKLNLDTEYNLVGMDWLQREWYDIVNCDRDPDASYGGCIWPVFKGTVQSFKKYGSDEWYTEHACGYSPEYDASHEYKVVGVIF